MKFLRYFALLATLEAIGFIIPISTYADWQRTINVMDTNTVGERVFQTYLMTEYVHWEEGTIVQLLTMQQFGVFEDIDLIIRFGYIWSDTEDGDSQSDVTDTWIISKFRVFNETTRFINTAVQLAIKLPSADDSKGLGSGETDMQLQVSASKTFRKLTGVVNGGYTLVGEPEHESLENQVYWGGELLYMVKDSTSVNISYDEMNSRYDSNASLEWLAVGSTWEFSENLQFFGRVEFGMTDDTNDWDFRAGIGYQF